MCVVWISVNSGWDFDCRPLMCTLVDHSLYGVNSGLVYIWLPVTGAAPPNVQTSITKKLISDWDVVFCDGTVAEHPLSFFKACGFTVHSGVLSMNVQINTNSMKIDKKQTVLHDCQAFLVLSTEVIVTKSWSTISDHVTSLWSQNCFVLFEFSPCGSLFALIQTRNKTFRCQPY